MSITIRLSEPLLKLRSRKDLVETMLHEMIHAYCFVLNIREGNGGHGPNFQKIMYAINKVAGTNITVYHTFNDEVDLYKQHWWRCNGVCQDRSPFFGYVKRTCNRAPGPNDIWWSRHMQNCGGTFMKIKEPEKPNKEKSKKNKKNSTSQNGDGEIHKYFTPVTGSNIAATGNARISNINSFNDLNKKSIGNFVAFYLISSICNPMNSVGMLFRRFYENQWRRWNDALKSQNFQLNIINSKSISAIFISRCILRSIQGYVNNWRKSS